MAETSTAAAASPPLVARIGCTVLHDPQQALADVVFVHGLGGRPDNTWTRSKETTIEKLESSKSKTKRHFPFLKSSKRSTVAAGPADAPRQEKVFWPRDILATDNEFKDLRIITYGYDSDVSNFFKGPASQGNILGLGRDFLNDLVSNRRSAKNRPLILVAHSLGGIVVKEALRQSNTLKDDQFYPEHYKIVSSIVGIIFFGTPHSGASAAEWGDNVRKIAAAVGFDQNAAILRGLSPDSERLEELRDAFNRILFGSDWRIYSFREDRGISSIPLLRERVVPDHSASIDDIHEQKSSIPGNHVEMCRFFGVNDPGYKRFKDALSSLMDHVKTRASEHQTILQQELLGTLYFDYLSQNNDLSVHFQSSSFGWIWDKTKFPSFETWLKSGGNFWITGKPGSGKSTMLKYLASGDALKKGISSTQPTADVVIALYSFDFKSISLARSIEGMLRGILYRIFESRPPSSHFMPSKSAALRRDMSGFAPHRQELENLLREVIEKAHNTVFCILIDALDEYEGQNIEIAEYLQEISKIPGLHLCCSSRYEADFVSSFDAGITLIMEYSTQIDIHDYVCARLASVSLKDKESAARVRKEIEDRADGVFRWVTLVCDDLLRTWRKTYHTSTFLERLKRTPQSLNEMHARIFTEIDEEDQEEVWKMLEIVRRSRWPLLVTELEYALDYSTASPKLPPCLASRIRDSPSSSKMQKNLEFIYRSDQALGNKIRTICSGLLEIKTSQLRVKHNLIERATVHFSHETVEEFILTRQQKKEKTSDDGHILLAFACIRLLISLDIAQLPYPWRRFKRNFKQESKFEQRSLPPSTSMFEQRSPSPQFQPEPWQRHQKIVISVRSKKEDPYKRAHFDDLGYPFLSYAVQSWVSHAASANRIKQLPTNLLLSLEGDTYKLWREMLRSLVRGDASSIDHRFSDSRRWRSAHSLSRVDVPSTLAEASIVHNIHSFSANVLTPVISRTHISEQPNANQISGDPLLLAAARAGDIDIASRLFQSGLKSPPGALDRCIFFHADDMELAKLFLVNGASADQHATFLDGFHSGDIVRWVNSPLNIALLQHNIPALELFRDFLTDITFESEIANALADAAFKNDPDWTLELLALGAPIDTMSRVSTGSSRQAASTKATPSPPDAKFGRSMLQELMGVHSVLSQFVRVGNITMVELLLKRGADPNLPSGVNAPLLIAAMRKDFKLTVLLLQHGARLEDTWPLAFIDSWRILRRLLKYVGPSYDHVVICAAKFGDSNCILRLLEKEYKVDLQNISDPQATLLHYALCSYNHGILPTWSIRTAIFLACRVVDVNAVDYYGHTSLFLALHSGSPKFAYHLLSNYEAHLKPKELRLLAHELECSSLLDNFADGWYRDLTHVATETVDIVENTTAWPSSWGQYSIERFLSALAGIDLGSGYQDVHAALENWLEPSEASACSDQQSSLSDEEDKTSTRSVSEANPQNDETQGQLVLYRDRACNTHSDVLHCSGAGSDLINVEEDTDSEACSISEWDIFLDDEYGDSLYDVTFSWPTLSSLEDDRPSTFPSNQPPLDPSPQDDNNGDKDDDDDEKRQGDKFVVRTITQEDIDEPGAFSYPGAGITKIPSDWCPGYVLSNLGYPFRRKGLFLVIPLKLRHAQVREIYDRAGDITLIHEDMRRLKLYDLCRLTNTNVNFGPQTMTMTTYYKRIKALEAAPLIGTTVLLSPDLCEAGKEVRRHNTGNESIAPSHERKIDRMGIFAGHATRSEWYDLLKKMSNDKDVVIETGGKIGYLGDIQNPYRNKLRTQKGVGGEGDRTVFPSRKVHIDVLIGLGYSFYQSNDNVVINLALQEDSIDQVLAMSRKKSAQASLDEADDSSEDEDENAAILERLLAESCKSFNDYMFSGTVRQFTDDDDNQAESIWWTALARNRVSLTLWDIFILEVLFDQEKGSMANSEASLSDQVREWRRRRQNRAITLDSPLIILDSSCRDSLLHLFQGILDTLRKQYVLSLVNVD